MHWFNKNGTAAFIHRWALEGHYTIKEVQGIIVASIQAVIRKP